MRKLLASILCVPTLLAAGCISIEQTLTLERNLSGKAGFAMNVNMEPMVGLMLGMERAMSGKTGEPTAAELEAARKEFLASAKTTSTGDFEQGKKELVSQLPKGVTLLDASFKDSGLQVAANFLFGFDQVSKLNQIKFPKKQDAASTGPGVPSGNPIESPFEGLQVVDEGATILVSSPAENPIADQQAGMGHMPMDPAMAKQLEALVKDLRVVVKITAPFTVVENNAHRREGTTLVWDYNGQMLQKLTPDQLKQGIKVRYRK